MNKLFYTYLLNLLIIIIVIFLYYTLFFKPSQHILTEKIENEFRNEMILKSYLLENAVSKFVEGAKSISSRSMIRLKIIEYKAGKINLSQLRSYTEPKYIDGMKALEDCFFAVRFVDNIPVAIYGDSLNKHFVYDISDTAKHELTVHIDLKDTLLNVCVMSPIIQDHVVLGYDLLCSSCSKVLKEILKGREGIELSLMIDKVDVQKNLNHNSNDTIIYSGDQVNYYFKSAFADVYYHFSKSKDNLFEELGIFRKRQLYLIILLVISISFILIILQQRAKLILYQKSSYLENLINEKTSELNEAIHELQATNIALKEKEEMLTYKNNELSRSNATKDKLFSIIAHDLMSPFTTLLGFSNLLLTNFEKLNSENQKDYISKIYETSQNTHKLLDNLLTWSRSQQKVMNINYSELNLSSLVNQTIEIFKSGADKKKIHISNIISEDIIVLADEEMLKVVFRNLISNAVKFSYEEGIIEISAQVKEIKPSQIIEISVTDQGIGIPYDVQEKLFNLNKSITTKGTHEESGTGLGLIICKEFVEKNKGKIWVKSQPDQGSKFIFTLVMG